MVNYEYVNYEAETIDHVTEEREARYYLKHYCGEKFFLLPELKAALTAVTDYLGCDATSYAAIPAEKSIEMFREYLEGLNYLCDEVGIELPKRLQDQRKTMRNEDGISE